MALTIPVDEIHAEARARRVDVRAAFVRALRVLCTVLLAVPFVLGWSVRKVVLGVVMLGTAFAVGWREAGREAKGGDDG